MLEGARASDRRVVSRRAPRRIAYAMASFRAGCLKRGLVPETSTLRDMRLATRVRIGCLPTDLDTRPPGVYDGRRRRHCWR
eukprot:9473666-Pyramimonas_sp.AAC.2